MTEQHKEFIKLGAFEIDKLIKKIAPSVTQIKDEKDIKFKDAAVVIKFIIKEYENFRKVNKI